MLRPFLAHITRKESGETRVHKFEDDDPFNPYIWQDGNYSCDCNRSLFFARAGGASDDESWEQCSECGDGEFFVRVSTPAGFIVYEDSPDR